jgi:2-keto-4-pentenoate hydratase/2-oxohepta-3-ene-1,7-dioic acid hydratase in catechol pathway
VIELESYFLKLIIEEKMRLIRYQLKNKIQLGWIYEEKIGLIEGDIFGDFRRLEVTIKLEEVKFLSPVVPSKIICIGRNYASHAAEHGVDVPEIPMIFLKPPSALIGHHEKIVLPPQSGLVEHEAELAVVIGKTGRWIKPENAANHIMGYTIANDVTARDLQRRDGQWTRGKGFDTFCPLGPWIETDFDPSDALIICKVNGEIRQMSSTRDMVFPVAQLIAFASTVMTLMPGDVLLTGTPAGVGVLKTGDQIEIEIENLGKLENIVGEDL